ncbi:MAG: hypothetical protein LBJ79_02050 [Endomicrobium sp.]|jgi:uncharacterized protein YcfL|nr:hypothetical protein [Endomicrobium sp.]
MKQVSFLAVVALFLNFGLVSCSSKKAEQAQEASQGTIEESVVEADANTSQYSSEASTETANAQAAE